VTSSTGIRASAQRLRRHAASELRPERLLPNLTAGLVIGVSEVIVAVSLAALIFAGELHEFLSSGIGFMLFGAAVVIAITSLLSSHAGIHGSIQEAPAAILSVIAAAIVVAMPAGASPEETFLTVVVAIAISSLLTGLFFLVLAHWRSGGLVRFLPYPVVGGFLAGTGWLLVVGATAVLADTGHGPPHLAELFEAELLRMWLPGLVFAVLLLAARGRWNRPLLVPAMIVAGVLVFYLIVWLSGTTIAELGAEGFLLGPFPKGQLWHPITPAELAQVEWSVILGQANGIATILIVSVVALLLNAGGLELVFETNLDLDSELRTAGIASVASGLGGSMVGYQSLSLSVFGHRSGATGRLAGLLVALLCAIMLFVGAELLSVFPTFILGGLLMFIGLGFLKEWVFDAWFKFTRLDYFVIILILVVIAVVGFFEGVAVGTLMAVALFVFNYSRTEVVRHALSGANFQSRVIRGRRELQVLRERGEQLFILQLQGFIFFGTANRLLENLEERIEAPDQVTPRFVVLDFTRVTGLDSTAILSFSRMRQLARQESMTLVFTGLSDEIGLQLEQGGFDLVNSWNVAAFPDLDHGLEWCENQILEMSDTPQNEGVLTLEEQMDEVVHDSLGVHHLMRILERQEVDTGYCLIRQGDPAKDLYFLESGQITAQLEVVGGEPFRLATMRAGQVVGEVGFYLGHERTASVVTEEPSTIYSLTKEGLRHLEETDPEAASVFHQVIARLLAERVEHLVGTVDALQR
jgi:SulP family sulfate permease